MISVVKKRGLVTACGHAGLSVVLDGFLASHGFTHAHDIINRQLEDLAVADVALFTCAIPLTFSR